MAKVTFDYSKAESFISNDEVNSMKEIAENAKKVLDICDELTMICLPNFLLCNVM